MDRPAYNHEYHQMLVYKIFLARKTGQGCVTFAQALELIRRVSALTCGLKQIVYLVGWQYQGHDSKYPSWAQVNERLGRAQDRDARDSLLWLMAEARSHNAIVSLHINMCDAYENSPLWDEYQRNDLFIRDQDGNLSKGGIWDGEQSYLVCKAREWQSSHARKRIDALLEMLPISEAGTIHIDVFMARPSPYHAITAEDDVAAMVEILHYWRSRRVDVTTEWFDPAFAGLVPMVYHLNLDEAGRLQYPPAVICGGGAAWNMRHVAVRGQPAWVGFFRMPQAGCLHEEVWGRSIDGDLTGSEDLPRFADEFYLQTLPWHFLNRLDIVEHVHTRERYEVRFSQDVTSSVRTDDGHLRICQGDRLLVDGTDLCVPASWRGRECIAYSHNGCEREWQLPADWGGVRRVAVQPLFPRLGVVEERPVANGWVRLALGPRQAVVLLPV